MTLSLQILTGTPVGNRWSVDKMATYSTRVRSFSISTNEHGFEALNVPLIPMSLPEAFEVYEWPGLPHVMITDNAAGIVWEGRLEDITIVQNGISLVALGYQRAFHDIPYTALWSKTGSGDWDALTTNDNAVYVSDRWEIDNNNRLYIAPRTGETYASGADMGGLTFVIPNRSVRNITNFSFDYDVTLPTNWKFQVGRNTDTFGSTTVEDTITGNGSQQTGSKSITLASPAERLVVRVYNSTGSPVTYAGDTGDYYAKATNIRIKTTTTATVTASEIADGLVSYISGINATQVNTAGLLIEATTTDLNDELYEDAYPADVLDRLALLHDYEWAVWEGRQLSFHERGSAGRSWYVDVTRIVELQRSLDNVRNSAYGVYRNAAGRMMRTASAGDAVAQSRAGVIRRGYIDVQTTSQGEAQIHRSTWLNDRKNAVIRAQIEFDHLYGAGGGEYPLYVLRAGDTVTMRNLPPTVSPDARRIQTFVIGRTQYDAGRDEISISPQDPTPRIEVLLARREARIK